MLTTLPPSCAVVVKSGNLNFLETSGPLQACNGTALPLYIYIYISLYIYITNHRPSDIPLHPTKTTKRNTKEGNIKARNLANNQTRFN